MDRKSLPISVVKVTIFKNTVLFSFAAAGSKIFPVSATTSYVELLIAQRSRIASKVVQNMVQKGPSKEIGTINVT